MFNGTDIAKWLDEFRCKRISLKCTGRIIPSKWLLNELIKDHWNVCAHYYIRHDVSHGYSLPNNRESGMAAISKKSSMLMPICVSPITFFAFPFHWISVSYQKRFMYIYFVYLYVTLLGFFVNFLCLSVNYWMRYS